MSLEGTFRYAADDLIRWNTILQKIREKSEHFNIAVAQGVDTDIDIDFHKKVENFVSRKYLEAYENCLQIVAMIMEEEKSKNA